jgi:hypothetical protein
MDHCTQIIFNKNYDNFNKNYPNLNISLLNIISLDFKRKFVLAYNLNGLKINRFRLKMNFLKEKYRKYNFLENNLNKILKFLLKRV